MLLLLLREFLGQTYLTVTVHAISEYLELSPNHRSFLHTPDIACNSNTCVLLDVFYGLLGVVNQLFIIITGPKNIFIDTIRILAAIIKQREPRIHNA